MRWRRATRLFRLNKLTGNTSKEIAGKIEKSIGKAQRNIGEAADEVRDTRKIPVTKDD